MLRRAIRCELRYRLALGELQLAPRALGISEPQLADTVDPAAADEHRAVVVAPHHPQHLLAAPHRPPARAAVHPREDGGIPQDRIADTRSVARRQGLSERP